GADSPVGNARCPVAAGHIHPVQRNDAAGVHAESSVEFLIFPSLGAPLASARRRLLQHTFPDLANDRPRRPEHTAAPEGAVHLAKQVDNHDRLRKPSSTCSTFWVHPFRGWHALRYSEGRGEPVFGCQPRPSEYLRACHPKS